MRPRQPVVMVKLFLLAAILCLVDCYDNEDHFRSSKTTEGKSATHKLIGKLFENYDKELMPTRPVYVKLDVLLLKVKSTVEKEGIFESVIALFIEWRDERMSWNPAEFDNVTVLSFDSEKVWLPDIAMTNSADHIYEISKDNRFVVRVTYDGLFKFVPTGTAKSWCDLKLMTFPFDVQTCSLEFESWSMDRSTMAFNETASVFVDGNFLSTQWTLCSNRTRVSTVYYDFSGETFSRVQFDFTVRRKSTFYMVNLFFPCAVLSAIQLLVYAIPSIDCSSDRIGFATTNLLTLVVFQTIVTSEMPKSSDAVTVLSKYIISSIILSAVGILESVIVERLRRTVHKPPPRFLIRLCRMCPLIWRKKQMPDFPSIMLASAVTGDSLPFPGLNLQSFGNNNGANNSDFISQRRVVVVADSNVDNDHEANSNSRPPVNNGAHTNGESMPNRQRKMSRFSAAREHKARRDFIEQQFGEMWAEIATRLDLIAFICSSICALVVPLALFLPYMYVSVGPGEEGYCGGFGSDDLDPAQSPRGISSY